MHFFQLFFQRTILDVFRFPLWWYTSGMLMMFRWFVHAMRAREERTGFLLWARNLFVPMYGQRDWQGKAISFFFRFIFLFFRFLAMFCWALVYVLIVLLYVLWPIGSIFFFSLTVL